MFILTVWREQLFLYIFNVESLCKNSLPLKIVQDFNLIFIKINFEYRFLKFLMSLVRLDYTQFSELFIKNSKCY